MRYEMISADCHVDLCWLPPTLFTEHASAAMRERMPHVVDSPKGSVWVTTKGAKLGHACGMARFDAHNPSPLGGEGRVRGTR